MDDELRRKARTLPRGPGVYLWKARDGTVLYVGKAQDLRARIANYLGRPGNDKQARMLAEATDVDFVAVGTVKEALVLEQNLIKRHRPAYNVLMVDDKKYPYIAITREPFPRVVYTRDLSGKGTYFGPFPDAWKAKQVARMLNKTFLLRQCRVLPKRECLYFHLKQCSGPCIAAVAPQAYRLQADAAADFLDGQGAELARRIRADMETAAAGNRFEEAAGLRDLAGAIDSVLERQHVEARQGGSADALGIAARDDRACAVIVFVREGLVVGRESHFLNGVRGEPLAHILNAFVSQYYAQAARPPREILLPAELEDPKPLEEALSQRAGHRIRLRAPHRGDDRRTVELAEKNAFLSLEQEFLLRERRGSGALEELQRLLDLPEPPERIEAFDVSHHHGQHTVASMVVLEEGRPLKSGYRRFKIQTTSGGDDPGAMREVVRRRYARLREEAGPDQWPELILVDGGPSQVKAAYEVLLELGLESVPLAGLAKRFEEIHRPHRLHPIRIDPHSSALHLLQTIRDEAHRFAIGYQGLLKRKALIRSALDDVEGVGPERRRRLLQGFGSVDAIRRATEEELARTPGIPRALARRILAALRAQEPATGDSAPER